MAICWAGVGKESPQTSGAMLTKQLVSIPSSRRSTEKRNIPLNQERRAHSVDGRQEFGRTSQISPVAGNVLTTNFISTLLPTTAFPAQLPTMRPEVVTISSGKRKRGVDLVEPLRRQARKTASEEPLIDDFDDSGASENDSIEDPTFDSAHGTPSATPATPSTPSARPKVYHCNFEGCNKSFARPSRLQEHTRSHTNERPFQCSQPGCGKSFLRDSHLSRHVKSAHTTVRDYTCDWPGCTKSFATGTRLRRHRAAHEEKEPFRCRDYPPCNEIFRKHATLQRHIKSEHLHEKPFPCTHVDEDTGVACGSGFDTSTKLNAHVRRMHTEIRYWCTLCMPDETEEVAHQLNESEPAGFHTAAALREHIKAVHPPVCELCGLQCSSQSELRIHIRVVHEGLPMGDQESVTCAYPDCGKTFSKPHNLKVHIRSVHEGKRPFVCSADAELESALVPGWDYADACQSSFTTKSALIEHVRTKHLGFESKQQARKRAKRDAAAARSDDVCADKTYYDGSALAQLTGVGYGEDSGRHIACILSNCEWRFTRDHDLKRHLRAAHGMDEDSITEAIMEREMLSGGPFWLGGEEERTVEDYGYFEDNLVLDQEMGIENGFDAVQVGIGADPTLDMEIDPHLEGA